MVSTIGPTSEQAPILQELVSEGIRVVRLNFSHATVEEADLRMTNLRNSTGRNGGVPTNNKGGEKDVLRKGCIGVVGRGRNMRASLLDTKGPEIRTLAIENDTTGKETLTLTKGDMIGVESDGGDGWLCSKYTFYVNYQGIEKVVEKGDRILLDDGAVTLEVNSITGETVSTVVLNTGQVRSRVGVNLPGVKTGLPAMSDKDRVDIKYAIENDVDYVAASFVRDRKGVEEIRDYINSHVKEGEVGPLIISKIENEEGLVNFEEILDSSDGIMVARGDLGVEIPLERVTLEQKNMVSRCNEVGKPVIVATQMLESMTKNPRPTRAEVSDVTNAVLDGADAVMLSGETAKGNYVVETVNAMQSIISQTEGWVKEQKGRKSTYVHERWKDCEYNSVAKAAVAAAQASDAKAIIVLTKTGRTARLISRHRPDVPIVCYTNSYKVGRQLQLYRGCHPVVGLGDLNPNERGEEAAGLTTEMGFLVKGDSFVMVQAEKTNMDGKNFIGMKIGVV